MNSRHSQYNGPPAEKQIPGKDLKETWWVSEGGKFIKIYLMVPVPFSPSEVFWSEFSLRFDSLQRWWVGKWMNGEWVNRSKRPPTKKKKKDTFVGDIETLMDGCEAVLSNFIITIFLKQINPLTPLLPPPSPNQRGAVNVQRWWIECVA